MSMLRVVSGAALAYVVLLAGMMAAARLVPGGRALWDAHWGLTVVVVPTLAAWFGAEVVHWVAPRRLLDRRTPRPVAQMAHGVIAAMLGAGVTAAVVPFAHPAVPDPVLTGLGALGGAVLGAALLRRLHPGRCIGCGYSLDGLCRALEHARCPECGRDLDPDELGLTLPGRGGIRTPQRGRLCADRSPHPT